MVFSAVYEYPRGASARKEVLETAAKIRVIGIDDLPRFLKGIR